MAGTGSSNRWTREELLLAINLYYRTPFGKQHSRNPEIITLADAIGRTPDSISMKLNNLTSLDPVERSRGVVGLSGASKLDRQVWKEFHDDRATLAVESERLWEGLFQDFDSTIPETTANPDIIQKVLSLRPFTGPVETTMVQRVRLGQKFFRKTVLSNYDNKCCITGLAVPELLRASHIVPWSESSDHRMNPQNGLCLSALHDAAFDRYLISINPESFQMVVSAKLRSNTPNTYLEQQFLAYEGKPIMLPEKYGPSTALLHQHFAKAVDNRE